MSTVPTASRPIDVDDLLQPIAGTNPAGESLRYEGTYDRIAEARREDDPKLSQGIYKSACKRADWPTVSAVCVEALTTRTKDLQIAGWLLEASLHRDGFTGVAKGLKVIAGLCERFWDDVYPTIDNGDLEGRIAPFDWIEQKLSLKLKQIPLTKPFEGESYSYVDWERACHFENIAMKDPRALQEALAKINPSVSAFRNAVRATERSFYQELVRDLDAAIEACTHLEEMLDEKCGKNAPGFRQFKQALNAIRQLICQDMGEEEVETGVLELESPQPAASEIEPSSGGPIRSRADAYRRLSEAADYLLRAEPHSPTPYLVKRAVEWGNMSLPELLQQIVRNEGELNEIDRLLQLTVKKLHVSSEALS
jgi:type VI secretion system protein ImpA